MDERAVNKLIKTKTQLTDIQVAPEGTLDVYLFSDNTLICIIPSQGEISRKISTALMQGEKVTLLGVSSVGTFNWYEEPDVGESFTITFACGEKLYYILAGQAAINSIGRGGKHA